MRAALWVACAIARLVRVIVMCIIIAVAVPVALLIAGDAALSRDVR